MLFKITSLASLVATIMAQGLGRCSTPKPELEDLALAAELARETRLMPRYEPVPVVIPTYFHLVATNETIEGGWVSVCILYHGRVLDANSLTTRRTRYSGSNMTSSTKTSDPTISASTSRKSLARCMRSGRKTVIP